MGPLATPPTGNTENNTPVTSEPAQERKYTESEFQEMMVLRTKEADAERAERNADLASAQTVRFSFLQTNGQPVHLCEDGEFRSNEDMAMIGLVD